MSIYIRSISGQIGAASEVIASTTVDLANVKITTSIKNGMMAIITTDGSRFIWNSISIASASSTVIVPNDGTSPGRWLSYKLNDTDISSTANISVSKLLAGPDGYILETVAGVPSWKPGGSAITLFGDVTGPGSSNTVIRLTGSSGIVNSGASILWDENISPILNIAQRIGNSAVKDFTISGQQPSSSSTSTNRNSGSIVLDIAAPYLDGYSGFVKIKQSGLQSILVGKVPGTSNIGIYFGSAAPTISNMSLSGDGYTYTQVNSSVGYSSLASGGIDYFAAGYSTSILDPSPGAFFSHLRQANLFHQGRQSDDIINDFIITSQAPYNIASTNLNSGKLILLTPPAVGAGTAGSILLKPNATTALTLNSLGALRLNAYGAGILHSDGYGNITSSSIVNSDISNSALITVNKLSPGSDGYILQTISSTPTWVSTGSLLETLNVANRTALSILNTSGINDCTQCVVRNPVSEYILIKTSVEVADGYNLVSATPSGIWYIQ